MDGPRPLNRTGMHCYANSMFQFLALSDRFWENLNVMERHQQEFRVSPMSVFRSCISEVRSILNRSEFNPYLAIARYPHGAIFQNLLNDIHGGGDPTEFLQCIESTCNNIAQEINALKIRENETRELVAYSMDPFSRTFGFMFRVYEHKECRRCGKESHDSPGLVQMTKVICHPMEDPNPNTYIQRIFEQTAFHLANRTTFFCDCSPNASQPMNLTYELVVLPETLVFFIDRKGDSPDVLNTTNVVFPEEIVIPAEYRNILIGKSTRLQGVRPRDPSQKTYRLKALVRYAGSASRMGHYFAYVKYGDTWYEANDVVIRKMDSFQAVQKDCGKHATMCFYE